MTRGGGARIAFLAAALLSGLACARIVPPAGGPEDREPPRVLRHSPDSAGVRVPREQPLTLVFSERMSHSAVRDWLRIAPWPGRLDCVWSGDTLTCRPEGGWREQTTYAVLLGKGARDRRQNALSQAVLFAFATGDSLAAGRVRGRVHTRALKAEGVTVFLFAWPETLAAPIEAQADLRPDPLRALRLAESGADGDFEILFVPPAERFLVAGLFDRDADRGYDSGEDLWGFAPEPVVCSDSGAAAVEVFLVYADEPGTLQGTVSDESCAGYVAPRLWRARADSLSRVLAGDLDAMGFARREADSLPEARLTAAEAESLRARRDALGAALEAARADSARCDPPIRVYVWSESDSLVAEVATAGKFEISDLAPGVYRLTAARDLNGDGRAGESEPAAPFPFPVGLRAGRTVAGIAWSLE